MANKSTYCLRSLPPLSDSVGGGSSQLNKIILQPHGVINLKTNQEYLIEYDTLKQKFQYDSNPKYTEEDKQFIQEHIARFKLNDPQCKTSSVIYVCEQVIENEKIPKKKFFNNLVAELFIDELREKDIDDAISLCNLIFDYSQT